MKFVDLLWPLRPSHFLIAILGVPLVLWGQSPTSDQAVPKGDEATVRDIQRIREQLQLDPLRGTLLEDIPLSDAAGRSSSSAFERSLRADVGLDVPIESDKSAADASGQRHTVSAAEHEYRRRSLRSLARRLDAVAHDMDELALYDEADEVRELSKAVRSQAH